MATYIKTIKLGADTIYPRTSLNNVFSIYFQEQANYVFNSIRDRLDDLFTRAVNLEDKLNRTKIYITASNINNYFTVQNDSYYFAGNGSIFTSNNKSVHSSNARTLLYPKQSCTLFFEYSYSSESSHDKFKITINGDNILLNGVSGTGSGNKACHINLGDYIDFSYKKDSSVHKNEDQCTFSNMYIILD